MEIFNGLISDYFRSKKKAGMAELADALASGASSRKRMGVQISLPAL